MKHIYKTFGLVLALFLVVPVITVHAQTEQEPAEQEAETETQNTAETTDNKRPERLEEYKERRTQALDTAKQNRIKSCCAAAQGKVQSVVARVNQIKANRANAYQQIGEKLDRVISKAELAAIDVSALKTAKADLQVEIDTFSTLLDEFIVTLEDLAAMDCASDPEAFQAALEVSRETRALLAEQAEDIRKLVKEDIKNLLTELRTRLAAKRIEDSVTEQTTGTETGEQ